MDLGVLLSLPVESVAIRAIVATVACVLLVRVALRVGIRTAGVRVLAAVTPALVIVAVAASAYSQPRLPTLMVPVEARDALAIQVGQGYLYFAPTMFPLLIALWAIIAGVRLSRRSLVAVATRRRARFAVTAGVRDGHVDRCARRVARRLGVAEPTVTLVERAAGGAHVVGVRRPVVVMDRALVDDLDRHELEAVLAHELAHVRRRDNLVAGALGVLRDLAFFVPGVGWASRRLHREREIAADQLAARTTRRPGALASGLLKVLEHAPRTAAACASLTSGSGLVDRVRLLVDAPAPPSRRRRVLELAGVSFAAVLAVALALVLPGHFAGAERQRDAVAIVWSAATAQPSDVGTSRAFEVYGRHRIASNALPTRSAPARYDERSIENRRSTLRACGAEGGTCPAPDHTMGLGLRPQPVVTVDDARVRSWQATPVVTGAPPSSGLRMYWLSWIG